MPETLRFTVDAPHGVIGLWDEAAFAPPASAGRKALPELREAAGRREVFFVEAEDAVSYNVELVVDGEVPPRIATVCARSGGSFGLVAPSGRLRLGGLPATGTAATIEAAPGDYLVTAMPRRPVEGGWLDAVVGEAVGPGDLRYERTVMQLGGLGCVAWMLLAVLLLIPAVRPSWPYLLPALGLPWFVFFALSRMPRCAGIARRRAEIEGALPHVALVLERTPAAREVAGGWASGP